VLTSEESEKLIRQLEEQNRAHPFEFKGKVRRMIMLGYLAVHALWITCLLLLLLFGWIIYASWNSDHLEGFLFGKILLAPTLGCLGALVLFLRLLSYQPKLPAGFTITGKDAPAFFVALEDVVAKLKMPRFSHVYLNADFNAGVVYLPSLMGLLPGETNLVIGLPLLAVLSVEETKAVLAHELGHLQRRDGAFGAWVNRNRILWLGLGLYMRQTGGILSGPANAFFSWYLPRLNACSLVGSRDFEYQSDQLAVQATSAVVMARALALTHTLGLCIREHLRLELLEQTKATRNVPNDFFEKLLQFIKDLVARGDLNEFLAQATVKHTDLMDSHPSLANRLAALKVAQVPDLRGQENNGLDLLRDSWDVILPLGNHVFKEGMQTKWENMHTQHLKNFGILARAENPEKPPETWNHQEVLQYAVAARQSSDFDTAWQWINYYISLQPEEAIGYLLRGQMAQERQDASCLADLRKAATLSPKIAPLAYRQIIHFAERHAPEVDIAPDRAALQRVERNLLDGRYGVPLDPEEEPVLG
jgi:Zn-dependent protease with chaperone function